MTVSVFIGTSVDGFIARSNGDLDFLPEGGGENVEALVKSVFAGVALVLVSTAIPGADALSVPWHDVASRADQLKR